MTDQTAAPADAGGGAIIMPHVPVLLNGQAVCEHDRDVWSCEVERLREEVSEAWLTAHAEAEIANEYRAQLATAATVDAGGAEDFMGLRSGHAIKDGKGDCWSCCQPFPCMTLRALNALDAAREEAREASEMVVQLVGREQAAREEGDRHFKAAVNWEMKARQWEREYDTATARAAELWDLLNLCDCSTCETTFAAVAAGKPVPHTCEATVRAASLIPYTVHLTRCQMSVAWDDLGSGPPCTCGLADARVSASPATTARSQESTTPHTCEATARAAGLERLQEENAVVLERYRVAMNLAVTAAIASAAAGDKQEQERDCTDTGCGRSYVEHQHRTDGSIWQRVEGPRPPEELLPTVADVTGILGVEREAVTHTADCGFHEIGRRTCACGEEANAEH